MARKRQFGDLTKRSQDRIAREGARYGLTRRQSRERYNRGTFNPLARTPEKRIPEHAPFYPVTVGRELRNRAMANIDKVLGPDFNDPFSPANRSTILNAVEHHASEAALIRMANASPNELKNWARYQKQYSHTVKTGKNKGKKQATPEWLRHLGWKDENGKWQNIFWYH